jgi:hypothetical protein
VSFLSEDEEEYRRSLFEDYDESEIDNSFHLTEYDEDEEDDEPWGSYDDDDSADDIVNPLQDMREDDERYEKIIGAKSLTPEAINIIRQINSLWENIDFENILSVNEYYDLYEQAEKSFTLTKDDKFAIQYIQEYNTTEALLIAKEILQE